MPTCKGKPARSRTSSSVLGYVIVVILALTLFEVLMTSWPLFYMFVMDSIIMWVWAGLLQLLLYVFVLVTDYIWER